MSWPVPVCDHRTPEHAQKGQTGPPPSECAFLYPKSIRRSRSRRGGDGSFRRFPRARAPKEPSLRLEAWCLLPRQSFQGFVNPEKTSSDRIGIRFMAEPPPSRGRLPRPIASFFGHRRGRAAACLSLGRHCRSPAILLGDQRSGRAGVLRGASARAVADHRAALAASTPSDYTTFR
jgi:hypothetical protein